MFLLLLAVRPEPLLMLELGHFLPPCRSFVILLIFCTSVFFHLLFIRFSTVVPLSLGNLADLLATLNKYNREVKMHVISDVTRKLSSLCLAGASENNASDLQLTSKFAVLHQICCEIARHDGNNVHLKRACLRIPKYVCKWISPISLKICR